MFKHQTCLKLDIPKWDQVKGSTEACYYCPSNAELFTKVRCRLLPSWSPKYSNNVCFPTFHDRRLQQVSSSIQDGASRGTMRWLAISCRGPTKCVAQRNRHTWHGNPALDIWIFISCCCSVANCPFIGPLFSDWNGGIDISWRQRMVASWWERVCIPAWNRLWN